MPIPIEITDFETEIGARVTKEHALVVTTVPASAELLASISQDSVNSTGQNTATQRYHNALLSNPLVSPDPTNMNVDGSSTPVTFEISAFTDADIYVTQVVIIIADNTVSANKFGSLAALTNGFNLHVSQDGTNTNIITNAKTEGQVMTQSGMNEAFGSAGSINEIGAYTGNNDARIITIPMDRYIPDGLKLPANTADRIVATISDNLTGLEEFSVRVLGSKRFV